MIRVLQVIVLTCGLIGSAIGLDMLSRQSSGTSHDDTDIAPPQTKGTLR